jgi:phage-related protein
MVDMSQALGQDLSSSAIQLGKALNDPINGITALSRVGVSFTEEQKELIRTMAEAGDIAGAQAVILAELEREFSGSAQAASDAAGAQEVYKDKMNDLQEQIGAKMIPIQEKLNEAKLALVTILADKVIPLLEELYAKHWPAISQAIEDITPIVQFFAEHAIAQIEGFARAVEGIVEIIDGVVQTVDAIFHGDWARAWDGMKQIATGAVDLFLGQIKAMFGNLPSILYNAGLNAGKAFANGILDAIGSMAGSITDALGSLIPDVGSLIPGNAGGTSSFAGGLTWVGEHGPELVRLPGGSSVYSNAESKQMGGGVSVTINGNVYAGSVDEAKNSLGNVGYGLQLAASMRGVAI